MYLSKVKITGAPCRNPYEIHRELWGLFPEEREANRDFLFRIERLGRNDAYILMQSSRCPESNTSSTEVIDWKACHLSPQAGQKLRFMLLANPTKKIDDEKGRLNERGEAKKCRVPLMKDEERREWIFRKFESVARIDSLIIDPRSPVYFRKKGKAGKIQPVLYQGILNVEDSDSFTQLIHKGIGPAKAFGCGLLSLARA